MKAKISTETPIWLTLNKSKVLKRPLFKTLDANPSPPEYLIHSEWDTVEMTQTGFVKVLVNHDIRKIHDDGVMAHLLRGPYIMFFEPMMEEAGWRSYL